MAEVLWRETAGDGEETKEPRLHVLAQLSGQDVYQLACGDAHAIVLTRAGAVFTWGSGMVGALGHGTRDHETAPRRVERLGAPGLRVHQVVAGGFLSAALSERGRVYCWGWDGCDASPCDKAPVEQLGLAPVEPISQLAAGSHHLAALHARGVATWGGGQALRAVLLPGAVQVACGAHHTAARTVDGSVYSWQCTPLDAQREGARGWAEQLHSAVSHSALAGAAQLACSGTHLLALAPGLRGSVRLDSMLAPGRRVREAALGAGALRLCGGPWHVFALSPADSEAAICATPPQDERAQSASVGAHDLPWRFGQRLPMGAPVIACAASGGQLLAVLDTTAVARGSESSPRAAPLCAPGNGPRRAARQPRASAQIGALSLAQPWAALAQHRALELRAPGAASAGRHSDEARRSPRDAAVGAHADGAVEYGARAPSPRLGFGGRWGGAWEDGRAEGCWSEEEVEAEAGARWEAAGEGGYGAGGAACGGHAWAQQASDDDRPRSGGALPFSPLRTRPAARTPLRAVGRLPHGATSPRAARGPHANGLALWSPSSPGSRQSRGSPRAALVPPTQLGWGGAAVAPGAAEGGAAQRRLAQGGLAASSAAERARAVRAWRHWVRLTARRRGGAAPPASAGAPRGTVVAQSPRAHSAPGSAHAERGAAMRPAQASPPRGARVLPRSPELSQRPSPRAASAPRPQLLRPARPSTPPRGAGVLPRSPELSQRPSPTAASAPRPQPQHPALPPRRMAPEEAAAAACEAAPFSAGEVARGRRGTDGRHRAPADSSAKGEGRSSGAETPRIAQPAQTRARACAAQPAPVAKPSPGEARASASPATSQRRAAACATPPRAAREAGGAAACQSRSNSVTSVGGRTPALRSSAAQAAEQAAPVAKPSPREARASAPPAASPRRASDCATPPRAAREAGDVAASQRRSGSDASAGGRAPALGSGAAAGARVGPSLQRASSAEKQQPDLSGALPGAAPAQRARAQERACAGSAAGPAERARAKEPTFSAGGAAATPRAQGPRRSLPTLPPRSASMPPLSPARRSGRGAAVSPPPRQAAPAGCAAAAGRAAAGSGAGGARAAAAAGKDAMVAVDWPHGGLSRALPHAPPAAPVRSPQARSAAATTGAGAGSGSPARRTRAIADALGGTAQGAAPSSGGDGRREEGGAANGSGGQPQPPRPLQQRPLQGAPAELGSARAPQLQRAQLAQSALVGQGTHAPAPQGAARPGDGSDGSRGADERASRPRAAPPDEAHASAGGSLAPRGALSAQLSAEGVLGDVLLFASAAAQYARLLSEAVPLAGARAPAGHDGALAHGLAMGAAAERALAAAEHARQAYVRAAGALGAGAGAEGAQASAGWSMPGARWSGASQPCAGGRRGASGAAELDARAALPVAVGLPALPSPAPTARVGSGADDETLARTPGIERPLRSVHSTLARSSPPGASPSPSSRPRCSCGTGVPKKDLFTTFNSTVRG